LVSPVEQVRLLSAGHLQAACTGQVKADQYAAFEEMWKKRDTYLKECNGFIRFALLKCDDPGEKNYNDSNWNKNKSSRPSVLQPYLAVCTSTLVKKKRKAKMVDFFME
jgi:hypothetical protein